MLALKLALVAAAVLLASLAARRFGHAVGGTIGGLPIIAGPVIGFVLLQEPKEQAQAIVRTTLVCLPAAIVHMTLFAHAATRWPWPVGLVLANAALLGVAALLLTLRLPLPLVYGLALLTPLLGLAAMPRLRSPAAPIAIPRAELLLRVAVAVAMTAAILESAARLPPLVAGLLLTTPIAANVLPCFTQPRHGAAATVALMTGFVRGLLGFAAFFVSLHLALAVLPVGRAYLLAWTVALAVALALHAGVQRWRGRQAKAALTRARAAVSGQRGAGAPPG